LTLYRLNGRGEYELQNDNPLWMPEIGLGIGTEIGTFQGVTREWLYWYDRLGNRYSTPEEGEGEAQLQRERAELEREQERQARKQAELEGEQERQRAEGMAARLQELGIDPDQLS